MEWENMTNENLFIAICALRLDKSCSAETFSSIVEEVEKRVEKGVQPKADLRKLVEKLEQEAARWEIDTGVFSSGYCAGIREAIIAINEIGGE